MEQYRCNYKSILVSYGGIIMKLIKLTQSNSNPIYFNRDHITNVSVSTKAAKGREVVSITTTCFNSSHGVGVYEVQESLDEVLCLIENC